MFHITNHMILMKISQCRWMYFRHRYASQPLYQQMDNPGAWVI